MINIDIFDSSFENSVFPGNKGVANAEIDKFVNVSDSLTIPALRTDQKAYAQYYNKLRNAVLSCQTHLAVTPNVTSCPLSSNQIGSNGSISDISLPYFHTVFLNDLIGWADRLHTVNFTTQVLPFEFVITPTDNPLFSNMWKKDKFYIVSENVYNLILGGSIVSVALSAVDTSAELQNNPVSTASPYTDSMINYFSTTHHVVQGAGYIGVRGFITNHHGIKTRDEWNSNGSHLRLILGILNL